MTTTTGSPLHAAVEELAARGPAWLADRRRTALRAYLDAPLPDRAVHLWRYTDPRRLLPDARLLAEADPGASCTGADQAGVRAGGLGATPSPGRFGTLSHDGAGKFEALNLALFSGGRGIEVANGARPEKPVALVHRAPAGADTFACPRVLVTVGEGAEVVLLELFESGPGDAGMVHAVTELFLAPGARVVHAVVNTLGPRVRAGMVQRARLESGALLTSISVGLGGEIAKVDASAVLAGEGARSEVLGLSFGTGRQHQDSHFFQDHAAPRTHSDLLVKTALMGRARASYTGRLRIVPDAPGCVARQENRNLLLSREARADSIPELEILTHEVHCSHAASTGPVDPEMLFYLRSRGLSKAEAERAIVLGFLEPVLERVPAEDLRDRLRESLRLRLEA